ncbi:MAG: ribonuclease Z [Bacteroidales bacterium]|nr:ribonuclease Z [Bacteroidales bacterium]
MTNFSITILGCNSAIPNLRRNPSAQALNINGIHCLIDCADGTQVQLRKFKIKFQKINHIFISHLHGDHYFGLIGLISSLHLLGRKNELHIYAPSQLEKIINIQFEASETVLKYPLHFHYLHQNKTETIFENNIFSVKAFPLEHSIPTWGFLFKEKQAKRNIKKSFAENANIPNNEYIKIQNGADFIDKDGKIYKNKSITTNPPKARSYAYCSDTAYFEKIIPIIKEVDILYHESTFAEDRKESAKEKFHSTAKDAARIAKKANVKKLLLGHYSARYKDTSPLLEEAKSVFPNTELTDDGSVFNIES